MFEAVLRGWSNYYGRVYPSAMNDIWKHLNTYLVQWIRRKYKRRTREYLTRSALASPISLRIGSLEYFQGGVQVVGAGSKRGLKCLGLLTIFPWNSVLFIW